MSGYGGVGSIRTKKVGGVGRKSRFFESGAVIEITLRCFLWVLVVDLEGLGDQINLSNVG